MATSLSQPIRVVLVDDHGVVRAGLRMLIESRPGLTVVGEASNGSEALAVVAHTQPYIIVLDLDLGGENGLPAVRFFAGHVAADTVHSARGFKVAETYCDTPELQAAAVTAVAAASNKRWNHMNGLYWYTLYGRTDDTPVDEV